MLQYEWAIRSSWLVEFYGTMLILDDISPPPLGYWQQDTKIPLSNWRLTAGGKRSVYQFNAFDGLG